MKSEEKQKVLTYRRAEYLYPQPEGMTLQHYLVQAHSQFPNIDQRRISLFGRPELEGRNFSAKKSLFLLHIAAYTPGEQASVVSKLQGVKGGDVETTPPPSDCEFMDGDIMALVSGNHVILCSSNLHERSAETYMTTIIERANINENAAKFSLSKVAKTDKVELIKRQGVKSISLDANLYNATLEYSERKTLSKKISGNLGGVLSSIFGKDTEGIDLEFAQNLSVRVILSLDQKKRGPVITGQKLNSVASEMLDDNDEGFSITTKGGETIRPNDVVLRKKIKLPRHGKTVYCSSAWDAMETYLSELQAGGLLEQ